MCLWLSGLALLIAWGLLSRVLERSFSRNGAKGTKNFNV